MNWDNYDKLVQHLNTVDAATFNYGKSYSAVDAGCLACHCAALETNDIKIRQAGQESIGRYLQVNRAESLFLYGYGSVPEDAARVIASGLGFGGDPYRLVRDLIGPVGIAEALRRLDIVAANYTRPLPVNHEAQFLDDVRAQARETMAATARAAVALGRVSMKGIADV